MNPFPIPSVHLVRCPQCEAVVSGRFTEVDIPRGHPLEVFWAKGPKFGNLFDCQCGLKFISATTPEGVPVIHPPQREPA